MAAVNIIDSIEITEERDTSKILAEWSAVDPSIAVYSSLKSAQAVKLFLKWSDQGGTVDLKAGDYFTFVIPDLFIYDFINNVTDVELKTGLDEVYATYSIYDNTENLKEIKITFTDYVDTRSNISGDYWILLFAGRVDTTEQKTLEFIINGVVAAEGEVTTIPTGSLTPIDRKAGFSLPTRSAGGYYIFEWLIYLNMDENTAGGFNTLADFTFEDYIPADSPHIFLTDEIRQELGIPSADFATEIGEYTGADLYSAQNRYQIFLNHYNSVDADIWYNFINWKPLQTGLTSVGIDGTGGLDVSDIDVTDKLYSAELGTVTRPTAIRVFTISTIKLVESALGDKEVVGLFKNNSKGSYGQDLNSTLTLYRFESGGSITGDYSFTFTKTDVSGAALEGAMFALYVSLDFSAGADRIAYSGTDGVVAFKSLPAGTYYILETRSPEDYAPNDTVYKVELSSSGFDIYYGDNFEYNLGDIGNTIVNKHEHGNPVSVMLTGTKNLTGTTLLSNMFNFVVKDSGGIVRATGTNNASGGIVFSEIKFDTPGVYNFTIEEVSGGYSGITYDSKIYTVTVTVTDDGSETLSADIVFPGGYDIFNNRYDVPPPPVTPCKCCVPRATACRKSICVQKVWIDNENALGRRPASAEIVLMRNGEAYKTVTIASADCGVYTFECLPIWKNTSEKYVYSVDEPDVPEGYKKSIDGFVITNTLDE